MSVKSVKDTFTTLGVQGKYFPGNLENSERIKEENLKSLFLAAVLNVLKAFCVTIQVFYYKPFL